MTTPSAFSTARQWVDLYQTRARQILRRSSSRDRPAVTKQLVQYAKEAIDDSILEHDDSKAHGLALRGGTSSQGSRLSSIMSSSPRGGPAGPDWTAPAVVAYTRKLLVMLGMSDAVEVAKLLREATAAGNDVPSGSPLMVVLMHYVNVLYSDGQSESNDVREIVEADMAPVFGPGARDALTVAQLYPLFGHMFKGATCGESDSERVDTAVNVLRGSAVEMHETVFIPVAIDRASKANSSSIPRKAVYAQANPPRPTSELGASGSPGGTQHDHHPPTPTNTPGLDPSAIGSTAKAPPTSLPKRWVAQPIDTPPQAGQLPNVTLNNSRPAEATSYVAPPPNNLPHSNGATRAPPVVKLASTTVTGGQPARTRGLDPSYRKMESDRYADVEAGANTSVSPPDAVAYPITEPLAIRWSQQFRTRSWMYFYVVARTLMLGLMIWEITWANGNNAIHTPAGLGYFIFTAVYVLLILVIRVLFWRPWRPFRSVIVASAELFGLVNVLLCAIMVLVAAGEGNTCKEYNAPVSPWLDGEYLPEQYFHCPAADAASFWVLLCLYGCLALVRVFGSDMPRRDASPLEKLRFGLAI